MHAQEILQYWATVSTVIVNYRCQSGNQSTCQFVYYVYLLAVLYCWYGIGQLLPTLDQFIGH